MYNLTSFLLSTRNDFNMPHLRISFHSSSSSSYVKNVRHRDYNILRLNNDEIKRDVV